MKGISRRARTCAVVAVTGSPPWRRPPPLSAQRPASMGDGLPVGQTGMQMFNFSRYISGTAAEQKAKVEEIFAMLQSKGIRVVEPYSLHGMTATRVPRAGRPVRPPRRRPPRRRRRGHVGQRDRDRQDARPAVHRLGRHRRSGPGHLRPDAGHGRDAQPPRQALRRGRRGQGLHPQPHRRVRRSKYDVNGTIKTAWEILMDNTDARYVAAEVDAGWASDAPVGRRRPAHALPHAHRDDARQGPHEHRAARPQRPARCSSAPVRSTTARSSPPRRTRTSSGTTTSSTRRPRRSTRSPPRATRSTPSAAPPRRRCTPRRRRSAPSRPPRRAPPPPVPIKVENLGDAPLNDHRRHARATRAATRADRVDAATSRSPARPAPPARCAAAAVGQAPSSCTVFVRFNPRRARHHVDRTLSSPRTRTRPPTASRSSPPAAPSLSAPVDGRRQRRQPALAGHHGPGQLRRVRARRRA